MQYYAIICDLMHPTVTPFPSQTSQLHLPCKDEEHLLGVTPVPLIDTIDLGVPTVHTS